ncbi:YuzF family protein [Metabacillus sp. GX 13764]|uniref:YuzF family protein n=1 Tax=Metabacillus kandeliae TaxID=2900151 RepID=UPI001E5E319B|nr:YuzF family protein [Metabacillus kandeliae]MCD7036219.1 YuzF family protein [Metabacillus kandeliae]
MANQQSESPKMVTLVEPYVYHTLQGAIGKTIIVQTVRDTLRGKLTDVKPDHAVIQIDGSTFFVRLQHIVYIMPENLQ